MQKYILSTRPFRDEFIQQIEQIDTTYQFVVDHEFPEAFDWQQVSITIGWSKDWESHLLKPNTSLQWVQSISAGVDTLPLNQFEELGMM